VSLRAVLPESPTEQPGTTGRLFVLWMQSPSSGQCAFVSQSPWHIFNAFDGVSPNHSSGVRPALFAGSSDATGALRRGGDALRRGGVDTALVFASVHLSHVLPVAPMPGLAVTVLQHHQ